MSYYYSTLANRLYNVDSISGVQGFDDGSASGSSSKEYSYDANGNMIEDLNRNIDMVYNCLNLPEKVYFPDWYNCSRLSFDYDAAGNKVRMLVEKNCGSQSNPNCTVEEEIHYAGNFVYVDNTLAYILNGHGRIVKSSSEFIYEYFITDHLGNVRVVFNEEGTSGANPKQYADYYPFEMRFTGTYLNNDNRYLYNSKEFEDNFELEWYDYGARFYDPALGRWHTPDLQAESNSSWSPYTYCLNDPLVYIDPSGELALFAFVTDYLATLFLKGGLSFNKNVRQSAWKKFDPTAPWSKTNQAFKIDYGLIRNEFTEWFHWQKGGTAWEYIQEFFSKVYPTEVIQSTMGYVYASTKIMRGKVDKIGYYEYRTTLRIKEGGLWLASGVSLGHYILGEGMALNPDDVGYDVKLLAYEFGHTYQSRIAGVLYLPKYGFPSAIWGYGSPAEKDADYRAYAKFGIWPHGKYNKGQPNRIKWWEYRYAPVIWPFMWLWN